MRIEEINHKNKIFHESNNEAFDIIGQLKVSFIEDKWHYDEVLFDEISSKSYPGDVLDLDSYIDSENKTIYYALEGEQYLGQIVVRDNWNKTCYVDDIAVKGDFRGRGIGRLLLEAAEAWGKNRGLKGFMLETQDINLIACRFYIKTGFTLGAVDTKLYEHLDIDEKALLWYKSFGE